MSAAMTRTGRCWKLPDQVSSDQLIGSHLAFEFDAKVLRQHLLEEVRPELLQQAQPGDCLVAGRNFANGSVHSHPFLAMQEMGLGLITKSMPRGGFRLAVFMGIPMLTADDLFYDNIADGDQLSIDFTTGAVKNISTGQEYRLQPLAPFLRDIIVSGGGLSYIKKLTNEVPA